MNKLKNTIVGIIYTILIGSCTGIIIWSFLKVMHIGIEFFWEYIPEKLNFKYY